MMPLASVDWQAMFFWLFAVITCGFALTVLFSSNVVHMAFFLILSLGASAGLFFLTGAEFVGAMQLMIYVGGTLVLLVFGVMLTAQSRFVSLRTPAGEWIVGAGGGRRAAVGSARGCPQRARLDASRIRTGSGCRWRIPRPQHRLDLVLPVCVWTSSSNRTRCCVAACRATCCRS